MTEKPCRNCGSKERYCQEVNASGPYGFNLLPIGWGGWLGQGRPKFNIQICGSCGLVEWFVPQGLLPKVKEKFPRV
jgi:hypothetical protein